MLALGKRDVPFAAEGRKIELQISQHASDGYTEDLVIAAESDAAFEGEALARKTQQIIRQNLGWALGYNLIAIPAAALGYVTPWLSGIGMSGSSLLGVLNGLRLSAASPGNSPREQTGSRIP